tara:strand:- start:14233 stop:15345 length:1113 start_codon:yes stop_codon:yes gene_type:complete
MSDYNTSSEENSFKDLYERDNENRFERRDSLIQKEEREIPKKEEPKKKGKSFVEMLTGDEDIGNFARQLNLDPELSEKLLVPLLSLLDKYNIGENVTANPRIESAVSTFEVIRDVAPVIKGAAEFVSGKKAELEADDMAYLEAIRQSQSVTDASLFEDEELFMMSEEEEEEEVYEAPAPAPQAPTPAFGSFSERDWTNFFSAQTGQVVKDPLDNQLTRELDALNDAVNSWANQQTGGINVAKQDQINYENALSVPSLEDMTTGMPNTIAEMIDTQFAIVDVGQLAQESGLSVNDVMEGDSQRKINNESQEDFNDEPFDLTELQPKEKDFEVDYSIVPEDAEEYDPFTVAGFDIPAFSATDIEEVNELMEE